MSRPGRAAHCTRMGMPVPLVHALVWDACDSNQHHAGSEEGRPFGRTQKTSTQTSTQTANPKQLQ